MCGIIGITSENIKLKTAFFKKNRSHIVDRGVEFNSLDKDNLFIGYTRLPTDDINNIKLNSIQQDNDEIFLFNGLISNVEDLVEKFHLPLHLKQSDALCLKYGYKKYGTSFISLCRGMFAFILVTKTTITLVRDTIGIKPMYYIHNQEMFGFASEIKALLNEYTTITELLPGEIVTFYRETFSITSKKFKYESYKHYARDDLMNCLVESIVEPTKRYLKQSINKRIGVLLSGGLDSSLILQILVNNLSRVDTSRIVAFCIGKKESNDYEAALQLCKLLKIKFIYVELYSDKESLEKIPEITYMVESKYSRVIKVALLQEKLAVEIKKNGIQVVISGEGADELFFGYKRFINGLTASQIGKINMRFLNNVFYYTLLQRYERVFARHQIEGRVPFLDQELIEIANKIKVDEKIKDVNTKCLSKMPLRLLAKESGLPEFIYYREKEKMIDGATGQSNSESDTGYLEYFIRKFTNKSASELILENYIKYFYNGNKDMLCKPKKFMTEEILLAKAYKYRERNIKNKTPVFMIE